MVNLCHSRFNRHIFFRFGDSLFALNFGKQTSDELNTQEIQCVSSKAALVPRYKCILEELTKHLIRAFNQTAIFTLVFSICTIDTPLHHRRSQKFDWEEPKMEIS